MPEVPGRVVSTQGLPGPSGGTIYNERIAHQWGVPLEGMPGRWPFPESADLRRLSRALTGAGSDVRAPVLLDGLIGCSAPSVVEAARASGRRVVLLVHLPLPAEVGLSTAQARELHDRESAALHAASAVACTSGWAAADLAQRYGLDRAIVAEPGVDPAPVALGSDPAQLLTVAAYSPRKNHRLLIEAFGDPAVAGFGWRAQWIGGEPSRGARDRLRAEVNGAGLAHRVAIDHARTGTSLAQTWSQSNLLLLPSITETYAMVVTEALARGIPAMVAAGTAAEQTLRGPGCPEDMPGAAVALNDPQAWSRVLAQWLTSASLRDRWRSAAMARRASGRDWRTTAHTLADIMRSGAGAP